MTEIHTVLTPRSQVWQCLICGATFVWHPGVSGMQVPSECACGEYEGDQAKLVKVEPDALQT